MEEHQNSLDWARVTGEAAPSTPVTREAYREAGIPWFDHYREDLSAVPGGSGLKRIKSLGQMGVLDDDGPGPVIHTGPGKRPRKVSQGRSYTTQTLGAFQYTTGSDGSRAVTQRIGDLRFTTVSPAYRPPGRSRW